MKYGLLIIVLLLAACGSNGSYIEPHVVSEDFLVSMCNSTSGCSEWGKNSDGDKWCNIYLRPYKDYANFKDPNHSTEKTYNEVYGHETRHCHEGHFHD